MALQRDFLASENGFGVALSQAYCRIVSGSFNDDLISFWVYVYADKAARDNGANCLISLQYSIPHPDYSIGISKQNLYEWLKTQEPFTNAADLLD